jgi:Uma2 family endonuclease
MATSVVFEEQIEIPYFHCLADFRAWATSDAFPERGRIDYIAGRVEVDMSPEDVFFHGSVKSQIVVTLGWLVRSAETGHLFTADTLVSCPAADLSVEPDVVYLSDEALDSGRVRLVPKATEEADRYVELEGPPDLVVEIVSDSSVGKDTRRLPAAYWQAGIPEFWLVDVRGERTYFQIHYRGAERYEAATPDAEGFQQSHVFEQRFRLDRKRNRHGRWIFDLKCRPGVD